MPSPQPVVLRPLSLRSPGPAVRRCALALGVYAAMLAPLTQAEEAVAPAVAPVEPAPATAATSPAPSPASTTTSADEPTLDTVVVEERAIDTNPYAEVGAPYKARISGDARHVKPLAETPQTISVLTQAQMEDSGRTDLREVLQAQPGITLGTGENGNAFGDRYVIRGYEARSDVFVDGLRDPGMTVRESFATEQVEITKGPSATFAGRGATGGAVNSITKQATTDADFTKLSAGVGTDDFYRLTLDANHAFSDDTALRVNLLKAYQEVPDRGPADRERQGVALSLHHKLTDKLNVTADYYHMGGEDKPDLGSWMVGSPAAAAKVVKNPPVYVQDTDYLRSNIDTYTVRVNYQHDDDTKVSNLTRYGTTTNRYLVTGGRNSTFVNADGDKAFDEDEDCAAPAGPAGSALAQTGLVSGGGMSREAALGKLFSLLGAGLPQAEVERLFALDLCGELVE